VLLRCVAVLALGQPGIVWAQQDADPDVFMDDVESLDQVDQRTPLSTAQGFMRFAELGDYATAAEYLDLRYLPKEFGDADGPQLAEQLYIVISRQLRIDFGELSDDPHGLEGDGLPSYRDSLGEIDSPRGRLPIYLQNIPGPGEATIWKISNASVARIPDLYSEFGYSPLVEAVRSVLPAASFLGLELFKWIIAILAGLAAALAWIAISWPLSRILTQRNAVNTERVKHYLMRPIPAAIFVLLGGSVLGDLGLGATASRIAKGGTLVTIVIVWLLFATTNLLRDLYTRFLQARGRDSGVMLLRPIATTMKVLVAVLAIVIWLDNVGVNVTALVAGLGVGGLAVALVLQKPLEDILGAITLFTQQPVGIGQFCTSGDITGTIEEISLRATRVRKINNSVVVIPNSVFATASIENISVRQRILHRQTVRLALDTSESTLKSVLKKLREMLIEKEKVAEDQSYVRLTGFGEFSIDVEVFAHVGTTDWWEFLAIAEDINLGTIGVLEGIGAKLAVPPR
jgi:MscS family membrane protein